VTTEALPDMRDRLVEKLEAAKYPVADINVVETGDDLIEIVAKLVATAVDPNELNAVAVEMQRQTGVRHATWEVSTTTDFSAVIPGRDEVASPESIHPHTLRLNGFRARCSGPRDARFRCIAPE
jgi:hypothetical protein